MVTACHRAPVQRPLAAAHVYDRLLCTVNTVEAMRWNCLPLLDRSFH